MKISGGRIIPHDYDQADYWTPRTRDGVVPGWLKRLAKGKKDFWNEWNFDDQQAQTLGSHDSYGQTMEWTPPAEGQRTNTVDFVRTWEMPQLSPTKSSASGSAMEYPSDRRRLESVQEAG